MGRRRLILLVLALLLVLWGGSRLKPWLAVDRCLDQGGRYDHAGQRCER